MDPPQNDKGKYRENHRPRGHKSNRGSRNPNQPQQNRYYFERYFNLDGSQGNASVAAEANVPHSSRSFNDGPQESYNDRPKHQKGQYGASNSKYAQDGSAPTNRKGGYESAQADCHNSSVDYQQEAEQAAEQRGKIIGGRYIRKHSNQPVHSHAQSQANTENGASCERNSNTSQSSSYKNIIKSCMSGSRFGQGRIFSGSDPRKRFFGKSSEDSSKRPSQASARKYEENGFASSDVYHYSAPNVDDQRSFKSNKERYSKSQVSTQSSYHENEATQRELLIQRLNKGDCECLVCCEQIRGKDQTWHCLACYHVFHLRCIKKWARSPNAVEGEGTWGCPTCRNVTSKVPYDYFCFCGKQKDPSVNYHLTPHTCGEICGRKRPECSHLCKELCHPGPCPLCSVVVQKSCPCGKTFKTTSCKQTIEETCKSDCEKVLNCGVHFCTSKCHTGACPPCEQTILQVCHCRKSRQTVLCNKKTALIKEFSCGEVCATELNCGKHFCSTLCHPDVCSPCSLSVESVRRCCCGKTSIDKLISSGKTKVRTSCLDPLPLCDNKCGRLLPCGAKDNPHTCQTKCHEEDCPKCPLATVMKCRCGAFTKEFNCADITPSFVFLCEKRCNRRKDCGRHKCLNNCCVQIEHRCELVCNKKLSCGTHQCPETCHMGNCPPCWNVSFDELRCHCGESVLYPPIHCGTKPPECSKPCIRSHPCDHEVKHTCHSDESCPPCTSLTVKWCYGHHKQCSTVMCFLDGVSCGMVCNKDLPCGSHKCKSTCHDGPCLKEDAKCLQPCTVSRPTCGHPCGSQCHEGPCPETPCKAQVTLNCPCGHRSENTTCYDSTKSYRLISVSMLASRMQEIKDGQTVNLNDVLGKKSKNNKLQCNEQCAVIERNKRLAVALQIQNPELSTSPGPPTYSEFLKEEAKKNPAIVAEIYGKISDLVQLAKESKQKCRSHSFPPMKRDHRRVVHELAEFFGCETESYDEEPKKNVVVTAYKTKCWLPFVSIMTVVQRDMGFRKGPAPVINQRETKSSSSSAASNGQKKKIDYFDYNE